MGGMILKMNDKKCEAFNSQFPNCHCNDCIENVVEFNGFKKGSIYILKAKNVPVAISSFCPLEHCADAFIISDFPVSQYNERFAWVNLTDLTYA